jgi:polar amino acid transport system substrate-binding protein
MAYRLFYCVAVLVVFLLGGPAYSQTVDDILKRGKVIIAVDTTTPPYGAVGPNGEPEGYDPDFARLIGKYLGVPAELVPVTPPNRIPYLLTSRVDMVVSLFSITPERSLQVAFSIPYANEASVLVAPKARGVSEFKDLAGLKVGLPRGTLQDMILTASAPQGTNILRFEDEATAIQAMISGQIDVLGTGSQVPRTMNRTHPGMDYEVKMVLREAHFGIGVRRGQTDLLQWLNTMIYAVKNNGELNQLSEKWRGTKLPDLPVF